MAPPHPSGLPQEQRDRLIRLACAVAWLDSSPDPQERACVEQLTERLGSSPEVSRRLPAWLTESPPVVDLELKAMSSGERRHFLIVASAVAAAAAMRHPTEERRLRWLHQCLQSPEPSATAGLAATPASAAAPPDGSLRRRTTSARGFHEARPLSGSQRAAIEQGQGTADALSDAESALRSALAGAQVGREGAWASEVGGALESLCAAVRSHQQEMLDRDGLYDEVRLEAPWLVPQVERLARQLEHLAFEAEDLLSLVARAQRGEHGVVQSVRPELERMLGLLVAIATKENDLVFERFYDEPAALD